MIRTLTQNGTALLLTALLASSAWAGNVKVENPWVRATAPGQKVAGAFVTLTAASNMTLVGAESPAAKVVQLHTMRMEDGVMIMREVKEIDLPKGKSVSLKPGGLHIMLIDLNNPIVADSQTDITLILKEKSGKESRLPISAQAIKPGGMGAMQHMH